MMWGQAHITKALIGLTVLLGTAHACYYQALNLENPADYYYRYCYAGCTAMKPDQAPYTACCTPLPAGATPPATCAQISKSRAQAGTTCQWGQVPTTDFPQSYTYASPPPVSSGKAAQGTQSTPTSKVTVWVTSTSTQPCTSTSTPLPAISATPVATTTGISIPPPAPPASKASSVPPSSAIMSIATSGGMLATWTASPSSSQPVTPASSNPPPPSSNSPPPPGTTVPVPSSGTIMSNTPNTRPSSSPGSSLISTPCPSNSGVSPSGTPSAKCPSSPCPYVGEVATGSVSVDQHRRAIARSIITPAPVAPREPPDFASGFEPVKEGLAVKNKRDGTPANSVGTVTYNSFVSSQVFYKCGDLWTLSTITSATSPTGADSKASTGKGVPTGTDTIKARDVPTPSSVDSKVGSTIVVPYYGTTACPFPSFSLDVSNRPTTVIITANGPIPTVPAQQTAPTPSSKGDATNVPVPSGPAPPGSIMTGPFVTGATCFCYPPGAATGASTGISPAAQSPITPASLPAPPATGPPAIQPSSPAVPTIGDAISVRTSLVTIISTIFETVGQPGTPAGSPSAPLRPISADSLASSAQLSTGQFTTVRLNTSPTAPGGTGPATGAQSTGPKAPGAGPTGPISVDVSRRRVKRLQPLQDRSKRSAKPPALVPCPCDCGTVVSTLGPTATGTNVTPTAPAPSSSPAKPSDSKASDSKVSDTKASDTKATPTNGTPSSAPTGGKPPGEGQADPSDQDPVDQARRELSSALGTLPPGFEFAGPGLIRRVGPPSNLGVALEPLPNVKREPEPELFWRSFLRTRRSELPEPRPDPEPKLDKREVPQYKRDATAETVTSTKWVTSTAGDCKPSPPPPPPPPQTSGQQDDDNDDCDDSTGVVSATPSTVAASSMPAQSPASVVSPSGGSSNASGTPTAPHVGDGPRPSGMGVDQQRRTGHMAEM